MTNYEKYKDKMIEYIFLGETCNFKRKFIGIKCGKTKCYDCEKLAKEWLEAEYVEPEVDWENVLIGTPVRVWDDDPHDKVDRIFIKYCPNRDYPYLVLNNETGNTARYENAELMEVNND